MNTALAHAGTPAPGIKPNLDSKPGRTTALLFVALLIGGAIYTGMSLSHEVSATHSHSTAFLPYLLLGIALLIALGFEFVNGFHDLLTLPMAMLLAGSLYWLMTKIF